MKLSLAVVSAALVSFGAVAQDKPKEQTQAQGEQSGASSGATQAQSETKQPGGQTQAAAQQKEQKSQMGQSPELVKQAQEKLSAQGHDAGPTDGIVGPKTQAAVKHFQQSKGLEATGQLDQKTLTALGVSGEGASASTGASAGGQTGGGQTGGSQGSGTSGQQPKPQQPSGEQPKDKK
jgi:peptidoglycan hydrolase-like protein with peptidoglycan-binding domain